MFKKDSIARLLVILSGDLSLGLHHPHLGPPPPPIIFWRGGEGGGTQFSQNSSFSDPPPPL